MQQWCTKLAKAAMVLNPSEIRHKGINYMWCVKGLMLILRVIV